MRCFLPAKPALFHLSFLICANTVFPTLRANPSIDPFFHHSNIFADPTYPKISTALIRDVLACVAYIHVWGRLASAQLAFFLHLFFFFFFYCAPILVPTLRTNPNMEFFSLFQYSKTFANITHPKTSVNCAYDFQTSMAYTQSKNPFGCTYFTLLRVFFHSVFRKYCIYCCFSSLVRLKQSSQNHPRLYIEKPTTSQREQIQ